MGLITRQSNHNNMNTAVVFLALVGCALSQAPEPVQDTPEVAAAKAHFFHLYNHAAHAAAVAPDYDVYGNHGYAHLGYAHLGFPYAGYGHHAYAGFPYAHHGFPYAHHAAYVPQDTPEVHAAKIAHFAAHDKALAAAADHRRKREAGRPHYKHHAHHAHHSKSYHGHRHH